MLACYRLGLLTGYLRWSTQRALRRALLMPEASTLRPVLALPRPMVMQRMLGTKGVAQLHAEAEMIIQGKATLFGAPPSPLVLSINRPLEDWTVEERRGVAFQATGGPDERDVKFTWEPGRFGWVFTLARAYHLSPDEKFAAAFWRLAEEFLDANPPYRGPHWTSAQEVALRLMALVFAAQVFQPADASTPDRRRRLAEAVAVHAARLPATRVYARAQNNNHLLLESVGLYTAGLALPDHPLANKWHSAGRRWIERALSTQIDQQGAYIQQSVNYHRLAVQAGLWAFQLARFAGEPFGETVRQRLAAATWWLIDLVDALSGKAPNLGPNDGAYILPMTICPFEDFRPVAQAAATVFLASTAYRPGPGDEMVLWLGEPARLEATRPIGRQADAQSNGILRHPTAASWAYLRAVRLSSRPGHADQLHFDLWWRGLNLARDPGSYLYNAPPPWDNALASTAVHNTLTLFGEEQMTPAGRFLWLDWAQGQILSTQRSLDGKRLQLTARHTGYRRYGVVHQRVVEAQPPGIWLVTDEVLPAAGGVSLADSREIRAGHRAKPWSARVHWLLPDWPWEVDGSGAGHFEIQLQSPHGAVGLRLWGGVSAHQTTFSLDRAGERLVGEGEAAPIAGWFAPTYGVKQPALSLSMMANGDLPLGFFSEWRLPEQAGASRRDES